MGQLLTDRFLRGLNPAPEGKRTVIWDSVVPGGHVRITDTGNVSYCVMKRIKGATLPIRRVAGYAWRVGQPLPIPLAGLRDMARDMLFDMAKGIDPRAKVIAAREAKEKDARSTFAAVYGDFAIEHVAGLRSGHAVGLVFKSEILPVFGKRPVAGISDQDVARLVKTVARTRPYRARNIFAYLSGFFNWAIAQRAYGLTVSPCTGLSMKDLIGKADPRQRVLTDSELVAVRAAAEALGNPASAFVRLLLLTGQRLREVSEMTWAGVDLEKAIWTISGARMKNGAAHVVPLAAEALALLKNIPRGSGPFVFSTCDGKKPVSGFSKLKARVDAAMPEKIADWRFHDLRRSLRTGLSALGVADIVSELVIAHAQKGLHAIYDRHSYLPEKRSALERWERHLRTIAEPALANVIKLARGAK